MKAEELIKEIYNRCPNMSKYPKEYTIDQIFDRTQDIIDMIERERPELKKDNFWKGGHMELPTHEHDLNSCGDNPHG